MNYTINQKDFRLIDDMDNLIKIIYNFHPFLFFFFFSSLMKNEQKEYMYVSAENVKKV